jgi:secreted trypsin-like serine protease
VSVQYEKFPQTILFLSSLDEKDGYWRIVNGENAVNGQFPWSGRLNHAGSSCSCSLIALNRVLTAAHCVRGLQGGTTFFGDVTRSGGVQRTFRPEDTFPHPRDGEGRGFDIAVLRLPIAYQPSSLIMPVALPFDANNFFENTSGMMTGFGRMAENAQAQILQFTPFTAMSRADCTAALGVRESVLCGRWPTSSACSGDSGGGFVVQVAGTWRVIGVHSFRLSSSNCGPGDVAGQVRVSDHLAWINGI